MHSAHKSGRIVWRACEKKNRYRTQAEARRFARLSMSRRPEAPLRVYECVICNGWHLTSRRQAE